MIIRILLTFIIILATTAATYAKSVKVESLSIVNSEQDATEFNAVILKDVKFRSGLVLKKDEVLTSHIEKFIPARRGKRSAYIIIKPVTIGEISLENYKLEGKTTTKKIISKENAKDTAKEAGINTAKRITNTLLPGSEEVIDFSRGLIKPEEGKTRLQSASGNLLDDLPTKHLKKGADLDIKEGDKLVLKIYRTDVSKIRYFKRNR
ncbi:hypothetical protein II906_07525 [bacterium]|nr:hypothetical protein [bacterium]